MYSLYDDWSSSSRVSPFGNRRIVGYLLLPAAYRSLSRPSSAPGAKASTLRSFLLDHFRVYSVTHWSGLFALCFGVLSYLKDNRLFRCLEYFFLSVSMCSFQGTIFKLSLDSDCIEQS